MTTRFRRAVITGGAGFLGSLLCRTLLEEGTEVVCLDNFLTGTRDALPEVPGGPPLDFRFCDVNEPFDVDGEVDLVMHLASPASPADYARYPLPTLDSGSLGTRNALDLAARKNARFLLASTSEVYGDPLESPQREAYHGNVNPVGPRSVYDEAKRYAEALTAQYHRQGLADTTVARIFNSYGPGMRPDDGRMIPNFVCQALRGDSLTVTGDGTQTRSLCYGQDTVRGLLLLAASDLAGPVNIGSPDEASVEEIALRIIELVDSRSAITYVPRPTDDPRSRKPDITIARTELGFDPAVGWREGLGETINWFRRYASSPIIAGAARGRNGRVRAAQARQAQIRSAQAGNPL
jgi:dTDP-glucose 4,6-dehydratase